MPRKALFIAGAAGPTETANAVLQRFGFAPAVLALNLDEAMSRVQEERFDLLVIPLQGLPAADLAAIEREIRKGRTNFIIGTAAQADPELILRAMRSGVHEFLVHPPEPNELAAAVDRLMRRTHADASSGMTIAVYSAKGGVGTTSIAINLAYALARNDPSARVALADLVVAGGDIRVLLDLKPAYDMGDLVKKVDRLDADLLHSLLTPTAGGVWALPASDDPELAEALDAQATAAIVGQLKAHFAFTVLDCEHHISERTLTALDVADRIVLVTQLNVAAIRSTQRTLALCQRLGYPADKLCVVVNRFSPGDIISPADAASLLQHEIFARIPNDYRTAVAAITKGVPVAVQSATSQLAASYTNLAVKLGGSPAEGDTASNGHAPASRLGRLLKLGRK